MLNYYCTWNAQNCARPDAVLEPSAEVFLGADGAKKARDYLDEDSIFGSGDLAGQFAPVRDQLYFLLDDGWDVPRGTHPVNDAAIESFGSLELARDRFPSFPGTPAQRLRGVNEALKARGWRGAGARRRAAKDSSAASGAARRAPNTGVPACAGAARPGSAIGRSTGAAGSLTRSGGSCWRN